MHFFKFFIHNQVNYMGTMCNTSEFQLFKPFHNIQNNYVIETLLSNVIESPQTEACCGKTTCAFLETRES